MSARRAGDPSTLAIGFLPASDKTHLFLVRGLQRPASEERPLCRRLWAVTSNKHGNGQTWEDATMAGLGAKPLCNACQATASTEWPTLEITIGRNLTPAGLESKKRRSKKKEGPPTQTEAAISAASVAKLKRAEVLAAVRKLGPSTCDEIAIHLGWVHQSCSPRVHELAKSGHLVNTGKKRTVKRSGRKAIVYAIAPEAPPLDVETQNERGKQGELFT